MHEPLCADIMFLCSCSSNDSLPAEGSDGFGEGKACPGVKDIPQDGLSILIQCKLFCVKEMTFHYLNLDTYLIIFFIKLLSLQSCSVVMDSACS